MINSSRAKYKLINSSSTCSLRDNKAYMKSMEEQLELSRMAADNISSFRNTEQLLKKRIEGTQLELHSCMLQLNSETKKQKVLTDLISLLKGEMFTIQTQQKHEEQEAASNHEKKVKKVEYDIEQILQKHNEQIAKINLLKQQANSCRSQRVVFSNLFKKLQRELKHYEEIYKETLLNTQAVMLRKSKESSTLHTSLQSHKALSSTSMSFFSGPVQPDNKKVEKARQTPSNHPNEGTTFLTSCGFKDTQNSKITDKNGGQTHQTNEMHKSQHSKQPKSRIAAIQEYQREIEKLEVYGGCDSVEELLTHYSGIKQQNQDLLETIEQFNLEIKELKEQNETIAFQRKNRHFAAQIFINTMEFITAQKVNFINPDSKVTESKIVSPEQKTLNQLLKSLQLGSDQKIDLATFEKLDWKIENIVSQLNPRQTKPPFEQAMTTQVYVESLLDRMQKFQDCEKILDKPSFQQQYFKQLHKGKRSLRSKKSQK